MLKNTFNKVDKKIKEYEIKKVELLLELGTLTYQNIRGIQIDKDRINNLSNEIFELDKKMYLTYQEVEKGNTQNNKTTCFCGNKLKIDDKFCSECGRKIEITEEKFEVIICSQCNCELEKDYDYCICCGYKVTNY
ncbi:MAG: hypothetical protein ACRDA3_02530 [Peptostreptococcaceae bacterium]